MRRYSRFAIVWILLLIGGVFVLYTGRAEPLVPTSSLPSFQTAMLTLVGAAVVGSVGLVLLENRSWKAMGREVGLTPDGSSTGLVPFVSLNEHGGALFTLFEKPDLTGTVDGYPVRVTTYSVGGGGEHSTSTRYTLVEAELAAPVDDGLVIGWGEEEGPIAHDDVPSGLPTSDVGNDFTAVGADSGERAEAILTPRVRTALESLDRASGVTVGDPTDAVMGAISESSDSALAGFAGSLMTSAFRDKRSFDASTVANSVEGSITDPDELSGQAGALAAVADAVERTDLEAVPA